MSAVKPKTALARLLDNVAGMNLEGAISGGDVGFAQEETHIAPDITVTTPEITLKSLDPTRCRPWQFADRPEDEMGDIEALAYSIKEYGQQEPILVRPISNLDSIEYEVIFGNRRWRACKQIGVNVIAIVKPINDQEAALYQKEENENRKDISDLAKARSFKAQLEAGVFKNEMELSKVLGISRQNLNDIMAFNRIPDQLIDAIPNFKNISRKTAVRLSILAKEPQMLEGLIILGTKIGAKEITATNLESFLHKVLNKNTQIPREAEDVFEIHDAGGKRIFIIKRNSNSDTTIKIAKHLNGKYDIQGLKTMIYQYLVDAKIN